MAEEGVITSCERAECLKLTGFEYRSRLTGERGRPERLSKKREVTSRNLRGCRFLQP